MASFTQNMRMSSIYPPDQRRREPMHYGNQGPGYDMAANPYPFKSTIPEENTVHKLLKDQTAANQLADLNRKSLDRRQFGSTEPIMKNVREGPNQSPAGTSLQDIDKRNERRESAERADAALALKERTLDQNLDFKYDKQAGDLGMKQKILDLKIPEREKLELLQKYGLEKIEATGAARDTTAGINNDSRERIQGMRGDQQQSNISLTGNQNRLLEDTRQGNRLETQGIGNTNQLAQIAARAAAQPISQSQQGVGQVNRAGQLLQTHPEYAGYIKFNPDTKSYDLTDAGDPETFKKISREIYGADSPSGDVKLPTNKKKTTTPIKTPVKPTSKYKMTVRAGK